MSTPLSNETAEYIRNRITEEVQSVNFLFALGEIHEISPHFIEDVLHFLELCDNIKSPSFVFSSSMRRRNGPI